MKRILLLILVIISLSHFVIADSIVIGTKTLDTCSKISNADNFSDYYIIGMIEGVSMFSATILHDDECFNLGYKFNHGNYYAIKKENYDLLKSINHTIDNFNNDSIIYQDSKEFSEFLSELKFDGILKPLSIDVFRRTITFIADPRSKITKEYTLNFENGEFSATSNTQVNYNSLIIILPMLSLVGLLLLLKKIYSRRVK